MVWTDEEKLTMLKSLLNEERAKRPQTACCLPIFLWQVGRLFKEPIPTEMMLR